MQTSFSMLVVTMLEHQSFNENLIIFKQQTLVNIRDVVLNHLAGFYRVEMNHKRKY